LLINPNNFEQIADTINEAINVPKIEQQTRNKVLQQRLERYNVEKWAQSFMNSLNAQKDRDAENVSRRLTDNHLNSILEAYSKAQKRILFLDYDGTLAGFHNDPQKAGPDKELYALLDALQNQKNTTLYLVSGRDKDTFTKWFLPKKYNMIVEHGVWITDPDFGSLRATELSEVLTSLIGTDDLSVLNGNKVMEIKSSNVNKGRATVRVLSEDHQDFIFAIGDDWTDEFMFQELPESTVTVKVGRHKTAAKFYVENTQKVRELLKSFVKA